MQDFINQLSRKYNLPVYMVEAIIQSGFRMTSDEMTAGTWKGTKFIGIGKVIAPDYRIQKYIKRQEEKNDKSKSDSTCIPGMGKIGLREDEHASQGTAGESQGEVPDL